MPKQKTLKDLTQLPTRKEWEESGFKHIHDDLCSVVTTEVTWVNRPEVSGKPWVLSLCNAHLGAALRVGFKPGTGDLPDCIDFAPLCAVCLNRFLLDDLVSCTCHLQSSCTVHPEGRES